MRGSRRGGSLGDVVCLMCSLEVACLGKVYEAHVRA